MIVSFLSLNVAQLNRLFPYFVLFDTDMIIVDMGDILKQTIGECIGDCLDNHFDSQLLREHAIETILGSQISISSKLITQPIVGKLEKIATQNLFLFAGENLQDGSKQKINNDSEAAFEIISQKAVANTPLKNRCSFNSIVENMGFGLIEMDVEGEIKYANKSFCKMSGYALTDLIGKKSGILFTNNFLAEPDVSLGNNDLCPGLFEIEFLDAIGIKKLCLTSRTLNYNEQNENIGWTSICFDVSQHKIFEQELITAKIDVERTTSVKEMFLANMSHEIRTPMNAIISMSNQLSKTDLSYQQEYFVQAVQTASKNLLAIIDDILDLTKIDAGEFNLEYVGFSLTMLLADLKQIIMHRAEKKGLEIYFLQTDQNKISPVLIGDPYRINQVVLKLMDNAVKFTEQGSVCLAVDVLENHYDYQKIEISVKDTGIGMDAEFVAHLFDNFTQEYGSVSRKFGGTGLGMSISQKLIAQMGGHFDVKSIKGEGSDISFVIDLKKGISIDIPNEVATIYNEELFLGRRILIVDDNEMNRLVASTILLGYGTQVMIAESGASALEMVGTESYDLILMDIQMPVINGYEATGMLRAHGYSGPIIALTASAVVGEREKCLAAGMDDYITKPINEELFVTMIDTWIQKKAAPVMLPEIDQPLYNLDGLRSISKGREDFVTKMIQMFCDNMPDTMNALNSSFQDNDLLGVSKLAHKLKSNIDHLGIISLQRTIRDIESLSDGDGAADVLVPMIAEVNSVISQVVQELQQEISKRN